MRITFVGAVAILGLVALFAFLLIALSPRRDPDKPVQ